MNGDADITKLLKAWSGGDSEARDRLIPLVYKELRHLARHYRHKSGAGDTLQTTALVNEAYLRLVDTHDVAWHDRVHFFAVSAQVMRRILVDFARTRPRIQKIKARKVRPPKLSKQHRHNYREDQADHDGGKESRQ